MRSSRHGNIILRDESSLFRELEEDVRVMFGDLRAKGLDACHPPDGFQSRKPLCRTMGIGSHANPDQQFGPDNSGKRVNFVWIERGSSSRRLPSFPRNDCGSVENQPHGFSGT